MRELAEQLEAVGQARQDLEEQLREAEAELERLRTALNRQQRASPSVEESLLIKSENSRLEERVSELEQQLSVSRSNSPSKLELSRGSDREELDRLRAELEQKASRADDMEDALV